MKIQKVISSQFIKNHYSCIIFRVHKMSPPGIQVFKCSYPGCKFWSGSQILFDRHKHDTLKVPLRCSLQCKIRYVCKFYIFVIHNLQQFCLQNTTSIFLKFAILTKLLILNFQEKSLKGPPKKVQNFLKIIVVSTYNHFLAKSTITDFFPSKITPGNSQWNFQSTPKVVRPKCPKCGKSYFNDSSLKRHLKTPHT
jgi:hypothetical protein